MPCLAPLPDRTVLEVAGPDRVGFLQGLVSADVARVAPERAAWSALLTPQGKWLADFFIVADPAAPVLLLDAEARQAPMLAQRLLRYRLRAGVTIAPSPLAVAAAWDVDAPASPPGGIVVRDPRLAAAGWRLLLPPEALADADADAADYDRHRLALGLPDGSRDLEEGRSVLLEAGFDELGAIGWDKGCYMGQELTARTRYRGLVKRRLVPVTVEGPLPAPGTPVTLAGEEVGTMRSGREGRGLAVLRLPALTAARLDCAGATLRPDPPGWMAAGAAEGG